MNFCPNFAFIWVSSSQFFSQLQRLLQLSFSSGKESGVLIVFGRLIIGRLSGREKGMEAL